MLAIAPWANEQSGHGGGDGHYAWARQHELALTKAGLAIAMPDPLTAETKLHPQYDTTPGMTSQ